LVLRERLQRLARRAHRVDDIGRVAQKAPQHQQPRHVVVGDQDARRRQGHASLYVHYQAREKLNATVVLPCWGEIDKWKFSSAAAYFCDRRCAAWSSASMAAACMARPSPTPSQVSL